MKKLIKKILVSKKARNKEAVNVLAAKLATVGTPWFD
jgi:hypothetical protein